MSSARVFFGGPDRPSRLLRDLLEERVEAVPSGGEIRWVTYYFRDQGLASALLRARRRGVGVMLSVEAAPRLRSANRDLRRRLEGAGGLGPGFRAIAHVGPGHLHAKLYYFSHPRPTALVGSFNPSGNPPDDPAIIRSIGDQDRGHNALVELTHPLLADGLAEYAGWLHRGGHGPLERFDPAANRVLEADGMQVYCFPRRRGDVLIRLLERIDYGGRVRIAASHVRDMEVVRSLCGLARRGVRVEIIGHHTRRRVPRRVERAFWQAGVAFHRYLHPEKLPMHNKFLLLEDDATRWVAFGSMNLTRSSRWLNHELLIVAQAPGLFAAFDERWEAMASG